MDNSVAYGLYLYTIDAYKRLVNMLPLDEKLFRFDSHCFSIIGELELGDEAFAAVSVRLMLQRKYFVRGKDLFIRGLLKSAEQDFASSKDVIESLLDSLDALNGKSIEFAFGDGRVVEGAYANVEDAMYGVLMHADITRAENLVSVPEHMRLIALAPYIAGREQIYCSSLSFLIMPESTRYRGKKRHRQLFHLNRKVLVARLRFRHFGEIFAVGILGVRTLRKRSASLAR